MALESERGLILDTHIWIWLNNASTEISSKTVASIDRATRKGHVAIVKGCKGNWRNLREFHK